MDCPRCGSPASALPECPRCGVILAKASSPRPARPPVRPAGRAPSSGPPGASLALAGLGIAVVLLGVGLHLRRPTVPATPVTDREEDPRLAQPDETAADETIPVPVGPVEVPPVPEEVDRAGEALRAARAADPDQEVASRLAERLRARLPVSPDDVRQAEELYARYPAPARDLLEAVLIGAAATHRRARRTDAALALLERARVVAPGSPNGLRALLALRAEAGDWPAAEAAARDLLALRPADAEAGRGLAYALVRQDRSREAADFLGAFVESSGDPEARALLERIRRDGAPEAALDEARLAHFHVRYDGEAHEDVGREIVRLAERHYATLVRTFDHQPKAPIPVVLLSRESYYDATGAPAWSGGLYDSFDGRVRIPIGGLTASLDSDLEGTLLHELVHAFVTDMSRGLAPREIHEGLAQLTEGKRSETLAGEEGLRALADGRLRGVAGFYLSALAFVEDLVAQRSQGGINDLLRTMAETGNSDEAFRRVYGKSMAGLRRDWAARLRQRHGS